MERKKWTPKTDITEEDLKFREKRKWQLAFRRYVIEKKLSPGYAPYFGLSISKFRDWIEIQFTPGLTWDNFGSAWQFDHLIPLAYFNFSNEHDLFLCWNFLNIRVQSIDLVGADKKAVDLIAVKPYYELLYTKTGYSLCKRMIDKIAEVEALNTKGDSDIEEFINSNKEDLELLTTLTTEEFNNLNQGISLADIITERDILKRFG